jgi:hypothetical protein
VKHIERRKAKQSIHQKLTFLMLMAAGRLVVRAGFAMVFALLAAAIIWNLGTWVPRTARLKFAHADRIDHRDRHCQPVDECAVGDERPGLGSGPQDRDLPEADFWKT